MSRVLKGVSSANLTTDVGGVYALSNAAVLTPIAADSRWTIGSHEFVVWTRLANVLVDLSNASTYGGATLTPSGAFGYATLQAGPSFGPATGAGELSDEEYEQYIMQSTTLLASRAGSTAALEAEIDGTGNSLEVRAACVSVALVMEKALPIMITM